MGEAGGGGSVVAPAPRTDAPDMGLAQKRRLKAMPEPNRILQGLSCTKKVWRCLRCACCAADSYFMDDITQYGVGIYMYFRDLKRLSWAFFAMALVALPAMLTHFWVNADGVEGCPGTLPMCLMYTMLGNVPPPEDDMWGDEFWSSGKDLEPEGVFFFYSVTDALYSFVLIVFIAWFAKAQLSELAILDDKAVTASDYCVQIGGMFGDLGTIDAGEGRGIAEFRDSVKAFVEDTLRTQLDTDREAQKNGLGSHSSMFK